MLRLIHAFDMNYESVLEYYNAFEDKTDINNYSIEKVKDGKDAYFNYIWTYEDSMYYLVDTENEEYIIGYGSLLDDEDFDFHEDFFNVGSIAYGVRPNERRKGYGSKILDMILEKCSKRGMKEVCISCNKGNIPSRKMILNHGGIFEKEFYHDFAGAGEKYWIKLDTPIKNINKSFTLKKEID